MIPSNTYQTSGCTNDTLTSALIAIAQPADTIATTGITYKPTQVIKFI